MITARTDEVITARTRSAEDTMELAGQVASVVVPGDVVLLAGDLGAGKTTFAKGFGRALGVEGAITSPTFVLAAVHSCNGQDIHTLVHADLYRLDSLGEVADLGIPELVDDGGVALVEWGDAAGGSLSPECLLVRMEIGEPEDARVLQLTTVGETWVPRVGRLASALGRWREGGK